MDVNIKKREMDSNISFIWTVKVLIFSTENISVSVKMEQNNIENSFDICTLNCIGDAEMVQWNDAIMLSV